MPGYDQMDGGRTSARTIRVWDPLVRLIHWLVVIGVLLNMALTDPDGAIHEYVGNAVLGLVLLRLIWGLLGPRPARFSSFPPAPRAAVRHAAGIVCGEHSVHLSHNPLGALMVYNIWLTLVLICATGIMMGTISFFGVEWVEQLHEAASNWLMISILMHVIAVIFDQRRTGVALVKAMITGKKNIPDGWSTK